MKRLTISEKDSLMSSETNISLLLSYFVGGTKWWVGHVIEHVPVMELSMVSAFKVSASNLRAYKKGSILEVCEAIPYIRRDSNFCVVV